MLGTKIDEKLLKIMWEESERLNMGSKEKQNEIDHGAQDKGGVQNEEMSEKLTFEDKLSIKESQTKFELPLHWNSIIILLSSFQKGFKSAMGSSYSKFTLIFEINELSYLFCGSMEGKDKTLDPLKFAEYISFVGHNVEKNKEYFMNNLVKKTKEEIGQFTKAITGSSTIDSLKKGKIITVDFRKPSNNGGKDIVIHTCSSTMECLSCPSQEVMDILFVAYFSSGRDVFGIG